MSAPAAVEGVETRRAAAQRGRSLRAELLRICLVPVFVVVCYMFQWSVLRSALAVAITLVLNVAHVPTHSLGPDQFLCGGTHYSVVISCTAIDVFFGSIPLVWDWRRSVPQNLAVLSAGFLMLSAVNLARLILGFALFLKGVPWILAHEAISGVFYFGVFLFVARRRGWVIGQARPTICL